jgi:hypothetical protein
LQFAHGLGLALHERPLISRLNSLEQPAEIKVGMVFALETYCPASDGFSAARIGSPSAPGKSLPIDSAGTHAKTRLFS